MKHHMVYLRGVNEGCGLGGTFKWSRLQNVTIGTLDGFGEGKLFKSNWLMEKSCLDFTNNFHFMRSLKGQTCHNSSQGSSLQLIKMTMNGVPGTSLEYDY